MEFQIRTIELTEEELLNDYLKAVDYLTISNEVKVNREIGLIMEQSKNNYDKVRSELEDTEREIGLLREKDYSNSDAIAALSDQVMRLISEIQMLKNIGNKF